MSNDTLDALRQSYLANPDNAVIAKLMMDAYADVGRIHEALELIAAAGRQSEPGPPNTDPPATDAEPEDSSNPVTDEPLNTVHPPPAPEALTSTGRPRLRVVSNDDTDQHEVDRVLNTPRRRKTFADVGGLSSVKAQIRKRIITPFKKPGVFARFKKRVGGGILMYGPPGCGKTLLAEATAGECSAEFIEVAITDVLDMWHGESERKLNALFERARSKKPTVLFFDEVEALGGKRQYSRDGASSKLVSALLAEMDGVSRNNDGLLVLAATNVPWAVDPAFRRPGRFDRVLFVPPPDRDARRAILDILLQDRPKQGSLALDRITKATSGFSGADLENLVETAVDAAIEKSIESGEDVPLDASDLKNALDEVKPTTLEWLTTARNYARYANESGQYDEVLDFLKRHGK